MVENDVGTIGATAIGSLLGAATIGTGGALLGGLIGYFVGRATERKGNRVK